MVLGRVAIQLACIIRFFSMGNRECTEFAVQLKRKPNKWGLGDFILVSWLIWFGRRGRGDANQSITQMGMDYIWRVKLQASCVRNAMKYEIVFRDEGLSERWLGSWVPEIHPFAERNNKQSRVTLAVNNLSSLDFIRLATATVSLFGGKPIFQLHKILSRNR